MSISPVQFARDFERLKSRLAANVADDIRLLYLIDFLEESRPVLDKPQFDTYRLELRQFIQTFTSAASLVDLPIEKLNHLAQVAELLDLPDQLTIIRFRLAQVYCYVSEFAEAVSVLSDNSTEVKLPEQLDSLRDREGLLVLHQYLKDTGSPIADKLQQIHSQWTLLSEELRHDQAYCLFVETSGESGACRGRLKALRASVELFGKSATTDEITFENQIKTPDDPFVGSSYNAISALREYFKTQGYKDKADRYYHGHFNIADSSQTFTGDSIGLGVAAVTFAGLMKAEIARHERLISQEVAFTGGVDDAGSITPVNEETLREKISRAFFSHIRFLVLPEDNLDAAKGILRQLEDEYPNRKLHLVPYERLSDVVDDKNILRSEKVCMGEYVARKAVRFGRATRLQVPILLALAYLLICLIYPKAWVGFDDNPKYVHPTKNGFEALNADSTRLWEVEYGCDTVNCRRWVVDDVNGDGVNEVYVLPQSSTVCSSSSMLYAYDFKGEMLFARDAVILHHCTADSTRNQTYNSHELKVIRFADDTFILTSLTRSHPARTHIKFWTSKGDLSGWYMDAGTATSWRKLSSDGSGVCEKLIFYGINNPEGSASLFVLAPDSAYGTAPPYEDEAYDTSSAGRGNQSLYMVFPPTDYCRKMHNQYNGVSEIKLFGSDLLDVMVEENVDGDEPLTYCLDGNLRAIECKKRDPFMRARERLVDIGLLEPMRDTTAYFTNLRDAVKYWTDSGWVTEGQLRAAGL